MVSENEQGKMQGNATGRDDIEEISDSSGNTRIIQCYKRIYGMKINRF